MKIFLDMIGCRLNQSELEIMARQFTAAGHKLVSDPGDADLAVVNTCTVTAAAAADSRKTIRRIARSGVDQIIATGCWSSLQPDQAWELPGVTEVVPNQKKHTLVPLLLAVDPTTIDPEPLKRVLIPGSRLRTRAFIKTQDGCQHHCAFCITTIARGESRSLPLERVVEEVRAAIRGGTREAVLTGVQLGSWGKDLNPSLTVPDLIEAILKETEISRLRMSSIEPWEVSPALIGLIQEERIARHLHLPLQSGSAAVLRRMGRAITPLQYEALITRIRESIPEIAITTDILTGFPAESEQEFEEGLEYIQRMKFADGHVFSFSARPGTPAADFPEQVKHPIRKRRAAVIRKLFMESAAVYREQFLGTQLTPLWEQVEHLGDGSWKAVGLTDNYLRVEATGSESLWNTFSTIRVTGITPKGISGKILDP